MIFTRSRCIVHKPHKVGDPFPPLGGYSSKPMKRQPTPPPPKYRWKGFEDYVDCDKSYKLKKFAEAEEGHQNTCDSRNHPPGEDKGAVNFFEKKPQPWELSTGSRTFLRSARLYPLSHEK